MLILPICPQNMALLQQKLGFSYLLILCLATLVSSHRPYTTPSVTRLTDSFPRVQVDSAFSKTFGAKNIQFLSNGSTVTLALDKISGSGLVSQSRYSYGFFSAAIKLPSGLSPGVVVAFYLSNSDKFPHNHDEIDIELLGHDKRNDWVIQTNIYANGSVSTGREEKFYFWFDPTQQYHYYSILWNSYHTVFLVDNIPVREFIHSNTYPSIYPSKPMSVYATIWDGSEWATHGGKYPVNYKYAPFVVSFAQIELSGCISDPTAPVSSCSKASSSGLDPVNGPEFTKLSQQQIAAMDWARRKLMFYSYCNDRSRFKVMPPECH
ncbi:putative xyloglucan endotransglucosylase/hydrolase protein 33 [Glycine max]|uniref:Xyloglucan endotransglucosylase/hydrolase n=2 Tax=Glycine soja TaxID=3848 RepID=A0A445FSS4_GLYSO|nr:probable xyloglucan endotransglucosylase/hydrolase protein 33 [Glycine soja]KAH1198149.1 putative xyloglucan endotransglucosylase/hydrolase protein 33 [Glycine max]KAH1198151.1 putative xyloglucan endotransglucosylase/hydrolase protein 33 [Glycine max]RZB51954.1 putative xyloglucan endotransglucosylase/hydrolase protein 33 isoform A [Glycine soja]RZB51955.1 putative xyloglucan endotransglucosylase/hydrolase protein 33 isoform B [Glycine soja]